MDAALTSDKTTMGVVEGSGAPRDTAGATGDPVRYEIGTAVNCKDGPVGELGRVVIDPITQSVTHLEIEPHNRHAMARLVPVSLAEVAGDEIRLRCTREGLHHLQYVQDCAFLPPDAWMLMDYPGDGVLAWPYFVPGPTVVMQDRLPLGEVEVRRGERVHAADGTMGHVRGLVVDPVDQHVTHVLVHAGRLWRAKDLAVPIGALDRVAADGVQVSLTTREIADLPALEVELPGERS